MSGFTHHQPDNETIDNYMNELETLIQLVTTGRVSAPSIGDDPFEYIYYHIAMSIATSINLYCGLRNVEGLTRNVAHDN